MKGLRLLTVGAICTIALSLTSCKSHKGTPTGLPVVELHQEWFPNANFSGEVSASKRFAAEEHINLKIVPGAEDVDPIKIVLSKGADYGVVGGDLLVAAVAKGAPLVAIGVANAESPTCFLVKAGSSIHGPADFPGHTVGILTGTNTERIYQLMMKKAGVDRSKVKEIEVPFELQTFILGQYDVRPAFIYDEPVSLQLQGIHYNVIDPAQFGVHFMGTVYFTRRDVLEKNRPLAQALVTSLIRGWTFASAHPSESLRDLLSDYPTLNADREGRSLQLALPHFAGESGKPLTASTARWQQMINGLEDIGVIAPHSVRVDQVWDSSLVDAANVK